MNDKPLVSIIVPIYNAVSYLNDTLTSILNQTYTNIQVILVNDGSTDSSSELCRAFQVVDKRVSLIEQANSGVSRARNVGLTIAKGEYVVFFDSDDIVETNAIELLIYKAIDSDLCDLVIGSYRVFGQSFNRVVKVEQYPSNEELVLAIIEGKSHAALWNKLIKRTAIEGISFNDEVSYMEDKLFLLEALQRKLSVSYCDNVVYNYRVVDAYSPIISSRAIGSYFFVNNYILDRYMCTISRERLMGNYYRSLCFLILNCRKYPFDSHYKIDYTLANNISSTRKLILFCHRIKLYRIINLIRWAKRLVNKLKT